MAAIKIFPSGQVHQMLPICPTLGMQSQDKKLALLQVRGGAAPSPRPGAYCRPEVRFSSVSMETTAYFVLELEVGRTVLCRYQRTLQVFRRCSVDIGMQIDRNVCTGLRRCCGRYNYCCGVVVGAVVLCPCSVWNHCQYPAWKISSPTLRCCLVLSCDGCCSFRFPPVEPSPSPHNSQNNFHRHPFVTQSNGSQIRIQINEIFW